MFSPSSLSTSPNPVRCCPAHMIMIIWVYQKTDNGSKRVKGIWSILRDMGRSIILENEVGHWIIVNKNCTEKTNSINNYMVIE